MDRPSLVQHFRFILSLASLAYTFTVIHAIQYTMENHDDSTTQNLQDHVSITLSSTNDTLATTSTSGTEKAKRWTEHEINLLLNYVEQNCILSTTRGLNLKKASFNGASDMIKTRDASQCHYKWNNVGIFVINEDSDYLSIIIAM
jgi:hypothetical protein